ncbi:MAG: hypothetical protein ABI477_12440 [Chryseolinea sp.]
MKLYLFFLLSVFFTEPLFSQNTLDKAGLTAATPAEVAFSLRKLSSTYSGYAIKVRRSADNAEANVAFDGSDGTSASSMVTFTAGVAVGSTLGNPQTGTITSDVSKTGTLIIKVNKTGTITTSNGSLTVTGTGTSFTTDLVTGDRLFNGANNVFLGVIASITNNTTLLLTNFSTVPLTSISYKTTFATVAGTGTNFTGELAAGDRLFTTANTYLGTIAAITNATTLTLNAVDAVAATAINYKGTSNTVTGVGTNFTTLTPGDLLISNNITLGIISSITNATSLSLTTKAGGSVSGLAFKSTTGTITFSTFYATTSVYVTTWYDQSGNSRDAIQLKLTSQARIVNAGILYLVNGRASMEFSSALASYLQTATVASYLNNTLYTLNKVTAEATVNPVLQLPISTTGGNGPGNSISHYGYRSSSQFTVAQYGNDQNFNATPSTSLEVHTSVKSSTASSQFYKNGISLGLLSSGAPSNLLTVGLLNIGYYTPTNSYYNGSISELTVFSSALNSANLVLLNDNQLANYNIASTFWTGAVSTDWTDAGNWSTGVVPTINSPAIVVIPTGKPRYPIISATSPANSISLEAATSLTITGTLQIAGTIINLGTCTASSGTVQYVGLAPQNVAANTFAGNAVQNVVINNSTSVTLGGNLTVSGNLTFTTGKLAIGTVILTITGNVTNTIAGGLTGGTNSSLVVNGSVSPTLSFDQTTAGTTNVLKNLTVNSSGQIITLGNNLVLSGTGTTTFTAGKLSIAATTLTMRGTVVNTVSDALRGSATSNVIVDGTISPTLSFDQTTPGTTNALNSLTLNCSGQTVTLNRSIVILSTLNLTAGTLADGGNQITSTGTITISSGTFKLGSPTVATTWPGFTTNTITAGTVDYASGVAQIVSGVPTYQNLIISAIGGTTAANNLTVNGLLTLSATNPTTTTGSLSMSTFTLNMGGSSTTAGQGDVTGIIKRTVIIPNISYSMGNEFTSITFPNTGTLPTQISIKVNIGTVPSWSAGVVKRSYDFIQTGGSGTKAVITAHYLDAELNGNVENKLVDFSYRFAGAILTEHGKSNFNTTQNWIALSNVNVAFFSSTFGNVELSFDESTLSTLTWNGSTSTSWITSTNWTPNGGPSTNTNLIIPDAGTTPNDPFLPATASNGSVTIESGGILNSDPGAQLNINNAGLSWSNVGIFNAGTSTITFTNANATLNGSTSFANVVINSGAALLLTTGAVMQIAGTMTNNGTLSSGLLPNTVEYNGNNQTIILPNGSTSSYYNLTISGSGTTVIPAGILNILGDLTINGAITAGSTVAMNGVNPQSINATSSLTLNNLNINNNTSTVSINQNLIVASTLTFTAGKLAIGNNTLTLSGNLVNTVPNGLTGGLSSNLVVNGSVSPILSFDQSVSGVSNALNNLIINSSGQVPLLGSDLEVNGTLTFTAGKLAINGKTLTLKGSLINTVTNGLRGSSNSNLVISGSTVSPVVSFDQTTAGTTNQLNNLTIGSTGQTVVLGNVLIVSGVLNLIDGLLTTTTGNNLTLTAAASFTGGSDLSFINGPLVRNTASTAAFGFPIGKNNIYRPISVTPSTAVAGVFSGEYFSSTPPAGTYGVGLTGIATDEYWDISKASGPDAVVELIYTASNTWSVGSPTSTDEIFIAHANGGVWDGVVGNTIPGNTGSGATSLTSSLMTSFSPFTFGFGQYTILPVTLVSFKANAVNSAVELAWTVADELLLSEYQLERTSSNLNFSTIASVKSINSSTKKTYKWTDNSPMYGVSYYRLKMIDYDGSITYSNLVKIGEKIRKGITLYPNPVTDNTIKLRMDDQLKGEYIVYLHNIFAETILVRQFIYDGTEDEISIDLNRNQPAGTYLLRIVDPEMNRTIFKIILP